MVVGKFRYEDLGAFLQGVKCLSRNVPFVGPEEVLGLVGPTH